MKKYLLSIVAIVVVLGGAWYFLKNDSTGDGLADEPKTPITQKPSGNNQTNTPLPGVVEEPSNQKTGTLQLSDKPSFGNLMLLPDTGTVKKIYISATRGDYSAMIGKKVVVRFKSGDAQSFALESITLAE